MGFRAIVSLSGTFVQTEKRGAWAGGGGVGSGMGSFLGTLPLCRENMPLPLVEEQS